MRKADYLILAKRIRQDVAKYSPANNYTGCMHEDVERMRSESLQAVSLGRYLAEHLAVDKHAFLDACGIKSIN